MTSSGTIDQALNTAGPIALQGKTAVVMGMGRSGLAAARLLRAKGASVRITDSRDAKILARSISEMEKEGCSCFPGNHPPALLDGADLLVLSPGVPHTIPFCRLAEKKGIPLIGEMELAWRFLDVPAVAVTGTNGKTTVTELIGAMLRASGQEIFMGGNIGTPLSEFILSRRNGSASNEIQPDEGRRAAGDVERVVVEVSSFQLDTARAIHPEVAVLLNITDDHLDRYPDFDAYAESKARLFVRQRETDIAVINGRDPGCRAAVKSIASTVLPFDRLPGDPAGAELMDKENRLALELPRSFALSFPDQKASGPTATDLPLSDMRSSGLKSIHLEIDLSRSALVGRHNRENLAAAALAALAAGATPEGVQAAIDNYECQPHRVQPVAERDDIRYFNDSKGTNPDAVARAVTAMDRPVVLIMGGRGKGNAFDGLAPVLTGRVHTLIAMGETGPEIADVLGSAVTRAVRATDMKDAVTKARTHARPGDAILLSPGCASFDLYANYGERGRDFIRLVTGEKSP